MKKKIIIAIDGYSGCGKSTLAKALAAHLDYKYIDSGAMYRCVTLYALRNSWISDFENKGRNKIIEHLGKIRIDFHFDVKKKQSMAYLNGEDVENEIRSVEVSRWVSPVSALPEVRRQLAKWQREMGKEGGVVMDGRDIGTHIFPHAEVKFFMTADDEIRAKRRFLELQKKGISVTLEEILENQKKRDYLDTHRSENPLIKAPDAILIDNTHLNEKEQFEMALQYVRKALD